MITVSKNSAKAKSLSSIRKKKLNITGLKNKKAKNVDKEKLLEVQPEKPKEVKHTHTKNKQKSKDMKVQLSKKTKGKGQNFESLKDIDPELYDFLKKNDKQLLEFNLLDTDDEDEQDQKKSSKMGKNTDSDEMDENDVDEEDDEKYHQPSGDLEIASDESDIEPEDEESMSSGSAQKITLNLLRHWQLQLGKSKVEIDTIRKVIQAFSSALLSISAEHNENVPIAYKVIGSAAFNGVLQLCVLHLQPSILRFLSVTPQSTIPLHKNKKWKKIRGCLRYYLSDLIRLIEQVSSPNILSVLLKHLHQMAIMVAPFTALGKTILKRLIALWSTGDETVRVVSFLCILKITRNQQVAMLNHVLKAMYLSYVRNSKFVSPNTLPAINFMRRSLVEMFALDLNVTYQHAFLYIRQLAIHLRNAVILKKKESFQACYNWQYINSLRLWSDLLGTTSDKPQLQPLVYPLITITLGVIRLIPTAQYFPLRFHCIQSLIDLAKTTRTFIPVLSLILEVLKSNTFNSKHTTVSMKPMQFTCVLRLNKGQLAENGFRDEVVEQVCGLILQYLAYESASLGFCDLAVHTVLALKSYLTECRNANYSRKIKQLMEKILDNSKFCEQERRRINFGLHDTAQIQAWETAVKNKGTPLDIYYNSWVKTHETKKRRQAAQADVVNSDYNLPSLKKVSKNSVSVKNENGAIELFPSDSEDDVNILGAEDSEEEIVEEKPRKKSAKEKKLKKKTNLGKEHEYNIPVEEIAEGDEDLDIVKDLDLDDW